MAKIVVGVSLNNDRTPLPSPVKCRAIVDTGANRLTLPLEWRDKFGAFPRSRKAVAQTASHTVDAEVCGPMEVTIDGFPPVSTDAVFMPMMPGEDGKYEPLLGHIPLEACGAVVDMENLRLTHAKYIDVKSVGDGGTVAITGGCHCGAVRYSIPCGGAGGGAGFCHCGACRKFSGGVGGAWLGVPEAEVSGEVVSYEHKADSGNVITRACCAQCRAPVWLRNSAMPTMYVFAAGSMDEPERFAPRVRIFCAAAAGWALPEEKADAMKRFEGMPQKTGGGG